MAEVFRYSTERFPPPRQARGTVLNTIMEDTHESHSAQSPKDSSPRANLLGISPLKLRTTNLPGSSSARLATYTPSPCSALTTSSCSDTEWESQMHECQGYDDLYDATDNDSIEDNDTIISDSCFSPDTRPSSLITPITRNSVSSTGSHKCYLKVQIPSPTVFSPTVRSPTTVDSKSSSLPPTPPAKIPLSPEVLLMLSRAAPRSNLLPSLDGSVSSDRDSFMEGLTTPVSRSPPATDWDMHNVQVQPSIDGTDGDLENGDVSSEFHNVPIAIESSNQDWRQVLGDFPWISTAAGDYPDTTTSSLHLDDEPIEEYDDLYDAPEHLDRGVSLPDLAMAMLSQIRLDEAPESWPETPERNGEMSQLQTSTSRPKSADGSTPASALSGYSFSDLSIPSPGGFFASLPPRTRHTWSIPNGNDQPSSAAAEGFYNQPWRRDEGRIVEQVVAWPEGPVEEEPLTAVRLEEDPRTATQPCETPTLRSVHEGSPVNHARHAVQDHDVSSPRSGHESEYDESYDRVLQHRADASHDRTNGWIAAQASYLSALSETNPMNDLEPEENPKSKETPEPKENPKPENESEPEAVDSESHDATAKTSEVVRLEEDTSQALSTLPSALANKDSIYWQGFQSLRECSAKTDGFLHRNTRYDAVQSMRLGMSDLHINCLTGKYELVRPERPSYKGPFSKAPRNTVIPSELAEKAHFAKLEKEQLVLTQLSEPMWAMDALRSLNGGNLLTSPAHRMLARTTSKPSTTQGSSKRSFRILDLGGHGSCEWAWQTAYEFPNAKIYTVTSKGQTVNSAIKGPSNHRQVTTVNLWELPFGNNQFDVISARSLHALLKTEHHVGEEGDEYDLVLEECMRCLKPGGYLEFQVLDAEISRAGPFAHATSVEFAFNLRARGYDPVASKKFLARLQNAGFGETKRSWMFLPIGMDPAEHHTLRETPTPRVPNPNQSPQAVQGPAGSTIDIANVTGLLGGWMWEQWLVKLRMEMGRERSKLLESVGALMEEGRKNGAGWTCLSGWAMKPKRKRVSASASA